MLYFCAKSCDHLTQGLFRFYYLGVKHERTNRAEHSPAIKTATYKKIYVRTYIWIRICYKLFKSLSVTNTSTGKGNLTDIKNERVVTLHFLLESFKYLDVSNPQLLVPSSSVRNYLNLMLNKSEGALMQTI